MSQASMSPFYAQPHNYSPYSSAPAGQWNACSASELSPCRDSLCRCRMELGGACETLLSHFEYASCSFSTWCMLEMEQHSCAVGFIPYPGAGGSSNDAPVARCIAVFQE